MKRRILKLFLLSFLWGLQVSAQDTWTRKADFGAGTRYGGFAIAIGDKAYLGMGIGNGTWQQDCWEFDPVTNSWTQKADFPGGLRFAPSGFAINGKGYIGSGSYTPGDLNWQWYNDLWQFDPVNNTWTRKADYNGQPRYQGMCFTINGKGYMGTGAYRQDRYHPAIYLNDFWEYDPLTDAWTQKANVPEQGRDGGIGLSIGNKGYMGLGFYYYDTRRFDFWEYSPASDLWTRKADYPGSGPVQAAAFGIGNKGYVGTGGNYASYKDFWEYNPATDTWTQKTDFAGDVRSMGSGFSMGTKGYIGMGTNSAGELSDFWEYTSVPEKPAPAIQFDPNSVTSYAGDGSAGFADGVDSSSKFRYPTGVIADTNGNLYIADYANHRIRKIDTAGNVSSFAGNGYPGFADGNGTGTQFNYPRGIAIDASGIIYVADEGNHRIRKILPDGTVTTFAGNGTQGYADGPGAEAQFNAPNGVAIDATGNIFVADYYNHRIRKITSGGMVSSFAGSTAGTNDGTGAAAQFYNPRSLYFDKAGDLYVTEVYGPLRKISPAAVVTTVGVAGMYGFQDGLLIDKQHQIYVSLVADNAHNYINKISNGGLFVNFAGFNTGYQNATGVLAKFGQATGLANDKWGNIYVADAGNNRIRKMAVPTINLTGYAGINSPNQLLSISGNYLNGDGLLTAPDGFQISLNETSGYGSTVAIPAVAGEINAVPVYIRLNENLGGGNYNGLLRLNSKDLPEQLLAVKGLVTDTSAPVMVVPPTQAFCFNSTGNYTIPVLTATDLSGVKNISYSITGATTRSAVDANASGAFNPGRSVISWKATDLFNNTRTGSTTVWVDNPMKAGIADVYPLLIWGQVNTLYIGFGPTCATLTATVTGGTKLPGNTYQYAWSTGATTKSINVCANAAGTYTYMVSVKDSMGCETIASKTITVIDARCDPHGKKLVVCLPGRTGYTSYCLSEPQAIIALLLGGRLGACGVGSSAFNNGTVMEEPVNADQGISVYPNPNNGVFNIQLNHLSNVVVTVTDPNGRIIARKVVNNTSDRQTILMNLGKPANGIYFVQVVGKEIVFSSKIIVQQ